MGNRKSYNRVAYYDRYGGRHDLTLSQNVMYSILEYTEAIHDDAIDAAQDIQKEMLNKIIDRTPVRDYPWNGGFIGTREEKYQPGVTKQSWIRVKNPGVLNDQKNYAMRQSRIGANIIKDSQPRTVFAIRNKRRAPLIHLLNFGHELILEKDKKRRYSGKVKGLYFVSEVQEWGRNELDRRIKQILDSK